MIKFVRKHVAYYYENEESLAKVLSVQDKNSRTYAEHAAFIVDLREDKILKNQIPTDRLVDIYMGTFNESVEKSRPLGKKEEA